MIVRGRIGLNRIVYPGAGLEDFFHFTAGLGLEKVELRNDLPERGITDGLPAEQVRKLLQRYSLKVLTINALQKFNVPSLLPELAEELKELIRLAVSIDCTAIVLCPNNDSSDGRKEAQIFEDTVRALKAFAPLLEDSGLLGYVEPLGFQESTLRSIETAQEMIRRTGFSGYRIVHDTFHQHLGPLALGSLKEILDVSLIGMIHVSGVEDPRPAVQYRDEHRILVGPGDRLGSRRQVELLLDLGYEGDICFEPFSEDIQNLTPAALETALRASIRYLCS